MTAYLSQLDDETAKCESDVKCHEDAIGVLRARIAGISFARLAFTALPQPEAPIPVVATKPVEKPARKPRRTKLQIEQDNLRAASDPTRQLGAAEAESDPGDIPEYLRRKA